MSWSMYVDIYVKKDNVWFATEIHDREFYGLKSLCDFRGMLSNSITATTLDTEDIQELDKIRESRASSEGTTPEDPSCSGYYYDWESFLKMKEMKLEELKKLSAEKAHLEQLKLSLDYLKLSENEKQNFTDDYVSISDDLDESEIQLTALIGIMSILELFSEFESQEAQAVVYIYSA